MRVKHQKKMNMRGDQTLTTTEHDTQKHAVKDPAHPSRVTDTTRHVLVDRRARLRGVRRASDASRRRRDASRRVAARISARPGARAPSVRGSRHGARTGFNREAVEKTESGLPPQKIFR